VAGELLIRQAAWHATLLHHFLYVLDLERALNFGEVQRPKSGVQFEIGIDFRQKLNVLCTSRGTTVYSGQGADIDMQSLEFILTGTLLYVQVPSVEKHSQLPRTPFRANLRICRQSRRGRTAISVAHHSVRGLDTLRSVWIQTRRTEAIMRSRRRTEEKISFASVAEPTR